MTKQIALTGKRGAGKLTLVDDEDFESSCRFRYSLSNCGYAERQTSINGKRITILLHREIFTPEPGKQTDHINGNKLDNRRCNLRSAKHAENLMNRGPQKNRTYKGFCWDKERQKYRSSIKVSRRYVHLGRHDSQVEAAQAYDRAAIKYFGEFAWTNFPRSDYETSEP